MGSWSIGHWLIVLAIVLLVFGTRRLRTIGSDLGATVRGFRDGIRDTETPASAVPVSTGDAPRPQ